MKKHPLYICGATATGKSTIALHLAKEIGGEIVNADAYQIYRDIPVLSASPDAETLQDAPHHLYGALPLETEMNAAYFRTLATPIIDEIQERGKTPIITGGSGLYLKFLTHGVSPIPASDPAIRKELESREHSELLEELKTLDPEVLETFPHENLRYVIRALEICLMTGQKASQLKRAWDTLPSPAPRGVLIDLPKEETLSSIENRTKWMLDHGAIEEVQELLNTEAPTASKAIGAREISSFLNGDMTRDECYERIVISTRQYAKRQRTWFKKEQWLTSFHPDALSEITSYATS